jgi:hypothetical protein
MVGKVAEAFKVAEALNASLSTQQDSEAV